MRHGRARMFHEPVLVDEVLAYLRPAGGTVVDATCGGGGHSRAILECLESCGSGQKPGRLLGLDLDAEAIASAERYLGGIDRDRVNGREGSGITAPGLFDAGESGYAGGDAGRRKESARWTLRQASYVDMVAIVEELRLAPVTGVLFDFGVSLHQLRTPERGFGHDLDGPLDMRFDPGRGMPARERLRRATVEELRGWLREFGEEPQAGRLARLIHRHREQIVTTRDLAALVKRVVPFRRARRTLARVFQALRIVTNDELGAVRRGLEAAFELLAPSGRLVTISYHSLEDRICKLFMRERAREGSMELLVRRVVRPGAAEVERNRAARSARLRAAVKLTRREAV